MKRLALLLLAVTVGAAACGRSASPTSPSAASSTSATINGTVNSTTGSAGTFGLTTGFTAGDAASTVPVGLTVTIVGTNITAIVDGTGHFELKGVPPGNADLRFNAPAFAALISLLGLEPSQTITLTVTMTSTGAVVESERRSSPGEEQLEGQIEALTVTTPTTGSIVVAGRTVIIDGSTTFFQGNATVTFADLAIGQRVHVKGQPSGLDLLARAIQIQNTNVGNQIPINGVIENFAGTPSAFQFEINGRLIKGDTFTEFFGNSAFTDLANGKTAEVKGMQDNGFVYAKRIHVEDSGVDTTIIGLLSAIGPPALTPILTVDGKTVTTTLQTDVQRKGDQQDLSVLVIGMTLEVEGKLQSDGSIAAKKIKIVGDPVGGAFQMTGPIGGLAGSCAATMSFSVNGYQIAADSSTTYLPGSFSCAALTNGLKVQVKGTVQSGGSVLSTSIEKK